MRLDLESDIEVVAEAESGEEAVRLARTIKPLVALIDVNMPGIGGLAAAREIIRNGDAAVILISIEDDTPARQAAADAGALAFVSKHDADRLLLPAIRAAAAPPE